MMHRIFRDRPPRVAIGVVVLALAVGLGGGYVLLSGGEDAGERPGAAGDGREQQVERAQREASTASSESDGREQQVERAQREASTASAESDRDLRSGGNRGQGSSPSSGTGLGGSGPGAHDAPLGTTPAPSGAQHTLPGEDVPTGEIPPAEHQK
jgi:hypothetical protein